jgi:hypothetical protein
MDVLRGDLSTYGSVRCAVWKIMLQKHSWKYTPETQLEICSENTAENILWRK